MSAGVIVALSDDLTGAVACAAELGASGAAVDVRRWDQPCPSRPVDAIVVDTESRPLGRSAAAARVHAVVAAVQERLGDGETGWYKRLDSRLAGHWAAELVAMCDVLDRSCVIAPAAPELGVVAGRDVDGLRSALACETRAGTCTVDPAARSGGLAASLAGALVTTPFVLCPARDRAELVRLAGAVEDLPARTRVACAGTFGFARAWAAARAIRARVSRRAGGVLAVVGSMAAASQDQLAHLVRRGEVTVVRSGSAGVADEIRTLLSAGADVVLAASFAGSGPSSAAPQPAKALQMATEVIDAVRLGSPRGVVLVGGDLASAVNQQAGTRKIQTFSEPWPAIPAVRFAGGHLDGTVGFVKSGRLGSDAWLEDAIALLQPRNHRGMR